MEVSARRSATLPVRTLCAGGVYGRSSPVSLCCMSSGPPGALDSDVYWPAQLCCVWPQDLEPTANGPPITRTVARIFQTPAQDPPVPALDSAGCSCGCRVPSSDAVVTVQRVRRQLQMSRLDSTFTWPTIVPTQYCFCCILLQVYYYY